MGPVVGPVSRPESRAADRDDPETAVPSDAAAVACPYCDRPFPEERLRTLHLGLSHPDRIDASEREAFEAAHGAEDAELRRFRLLALAAVVATYFGLLFVYAVVT